MALEAERNHLPPMMDPAQRALAERAIARHRRADSVHAGDPAPAVAFIALGDVNAAPVYPDQLARTTGRPIVLCFGSYT